jgi:carbamoyltransferase
MDLASSVQAVTEEVVLRMAAHVHRETQQSNLCLAGGVALNCVANGRVLREGPFENLWIQPGAGDSGGAIGAALTAWHMYAGQTRSRETADSMNGAYLGPEYSEDEIRAFLEEKEVTFEIAASDEQLVETVSSLIADQLVVGWFQGRMEFGPRALGNRSILADPRGRDVQRTVNLKIKYRESFRPFAASVLRDRCRDFFELDRDSPYMLIVDQVRNAQVSGSGLERLSRIDSPVPAVTHVDGSCRIQTVDAITNPLYAKLLEAFERRTDCPLLVNTSFNVRGEPIVCTPEDAFNCFMNTHLDVLVMGRCIVRKTEIPDADLSILTAEQIARQYGLD